MADSDKVRAAHIDRMLHTALKRLRDAELLESTFPPSPGDSAYLLKLISFEILLKAAYSVHVGPPPRGSQGHNYKKMFCELPFEVRSRILSRAQERTGGMADYDNLSDLLKTFSGSFIRMRYPYERYEAMSTEEYVRRARDWLNRGAATEEADYVFWPGELGGLLHALRSEVEEFLGGD